MDPKNIPVIIGTAQLVDREADVDRHIEPLDMLERVAREAVADAGVSSALLSALDTVALVGIAGWHPQNAPNLLAGRLGANPVREYTTGIGGQIGVTLLNRVAQEIVDGKADTALIAGCNNLRVLLRARASGQQLAWMRGGEGSAQMVGTDDPGNTPLEASYGMEQPPDIYPIFENALRARLGLSMSEHRARMGQLFAGFTEVAAANPHAWFPTARSADELVSVTPANRMIGFPYPKYLNAILNTEQAAGLIVCSLEKARTLGLADDRCVFWRGGAESQEAAYWASERPDFSTCPSMLDTQLSTLANAGLHVDQMDAFDFYSCFPVAVQVAADGLGLAVDDPRGFTVTGGLPYAGGPASAYTLHSLASMASRLRDQTGAGLVTGNGWYLTKHSAAVLASTPGNSLPRRGLLDDLPSTEMVTAAKPVNTTATGTGTIEAYTALYNREGEPVRGIVLGRTTAGDRFLANTPPEAGLLADFVKDEQVGRVGQLSQMDGRCVFAPA